jgi:hypothetical protein
MDVSYAFEDGSTPVFYSKPIPRGTIISNFRGSFTPDTGCPVSFPMPLSSLVLAEIAIDVAYLADLLNKASNNQKIDGHAFQEAVLLLCYRLVNESAIKERGNEKDVDRLCQLTLISFLTMLLLEYGQSPLRYGLLSRKLKAAIEQTACLDTNVRLLLWCNFVGGVALFTPSDDSWMRPLICRICVQLKLTNWAEVRQILISFAWIKSIHDKPGKALWDTMMKRATGGGGTDGVSTTGQESPTSSTSFSTTS